MRVKDIEIGEYYRLKTSPTYGYVKALEVIQPKSGINTTRNILVKCEHVVYKSDKVGFIRYFKVSEIIKEA